MNRSYGKRLGGALAGLSALALTLPSAPASAAYGPNSGDPGVARISTVSGDVVVHRTDVSGDYGAALNAPVSVGDYIATRGGRTEVEFDHATVLRVAPQTEVRFTHLTPNEHAVQLAQGTVEMRLFRGTAGHPDVQTPAADLRPAGDGRYRITVDANGDTRVMVRSGRLDVATNGRFGTRELGAGQSVEIAGAGDATRVRPIATVAYDSFDGWCDARDGGWSHVSNWTYVDAGMVGENDLSDYGSWSNDPQYGSVWSPSDVPADWSPYSDGQYVWAADYGWTWVGNEPWGYAPYHYGRWFHGDRGWCWTPGAYDYGHEYAYAPALVGFFALGSGFGISFAIGDVGWVPLAPGEAYRPWWNGGDRGFNRNRRYDLGDAGRVYRNARYAGAAIVVSGRDFADGRFTHVRRFGGRHLAHATAFAGVVPVVPTVHNLAFNARHTSVERIAIARGFKRMAAPHIVTPTFARQRIAVAPIARHQHPVYAPSVARQYVAPNRGSGFTTIVSRPQPRIERAPQPVAQRPVQRRFAAPQQPARPVSVWDRFDHPATTHAHAPAPQAAYAARRRGMNRSERTSLRR